MSTPSPAEMSDAAALLEDIEKRACAFARAAGEQLTPKHRAAALVPLLREIAAVRADKRPRKSPFWWVVKRKDGRYSADDEMEPWSPKQRKAQTFAHRKTAAALAKWFAYYGAHVVRVRARSAS